MRSAQRSDLCCVFKALSFKISTLHWEIAHSIHLLRRTFAANPKCFLTWDTAEVTFLALLLLASL